jgi:hypothetical protein
MTTKPQTDNASIDLNALKGLSADQLTAVLMAIKANDNIAEAEKSYAQQIRVTHTRVGEKVYDYKFWHEGGAFSTGRKAGLSIPADLFVKYLTDAEYLSKVAVACKQSKTVGDLPIDEIIEAFQSLK